MSERARCPQRELWRAAGAPLTPGAPGEPWVRPLRERFVVLVERTGARRITNNGELEARLRARLRGYEVVVRARVAAAAVHEWRAHGAARRRACLAGGA